MRRLKDEARILLVYCAEGTCALLALRGLKSLDEVAVCEQRELLERVTSLRTLGELTYVYCIGVACDEIRTYARLAGRELYPLAGCNLRLRADLDSWVSFAARVVEEVRAVSGRGRAGAHSDPPSAQHLPGGGR